MTESSIKTLDDIYSYYEECLKYRRPVKSLIVKPDVFDSLIRTLEDRDLFLIKASKYNMFIYNGVTVYREGE